MSATNLAKVPLYFGAPERPLFGFYHPPAGSRVRATGVLLCNPLGDDLIRAHRPFRHLAEDLSAAGFPVLRFDFDGVGAPTVDLAVISPTGTATLFAKLYDVAPDGSLTLPSGLVAPLALTGVSTDPAAPTTVAVTLPGIDHRFETGHTMRVVVSTTDQGYALPADAAVYGVGLAAGAGLSVPSV